MRLIVAMLMMLVANLGTGHAQSPQATRTASASVPIYRPIPFDTSNGSPARASAVDLLRANGTTNIPLSDVKAAFVTLSSAEPPMLLFTVQNGAYCGNGGCTYSLYRKGTSDWIKTNEWLALDVRLATKSRAQWREIAVYHPTHPGLEVERWTWQVYRYFGPGNGDGMTGNTTLR